MQLKGIRLRYARILAGCLLLGSVFWRCPVLSAASDDSWTGPDKVKHVTVSFVLSTIAYNFYLKNTSWSENASKAAALVTTLAVGAAKECRDEEFSWKDMGANAAGAGLGIAIAIEF